MRSGSSWRSVASSLETSRAPPGAGSRDSVCVRRRRRSIRSPVGSSREFGRDDLREVIGQMVPGTGIMAIAREQMVPEQMVPGTGIMAIAMNALAIGPR